MKQRHIERRIVSPDPVPFHRLEKAMLVIVAGHPGVEHGLDAARKHLEAEDYGAAQGMQDGDGL